jgi:hypothetical protein
MTDRYPSLGALIEAEGLAEVAVIVEADYSWRAMGVYWSPRARSYFLYSDGGCSCYGYGDFDVALADLRNVDRPTAVRELGDFGKGSIEPADVVAREVAKVRDFREVSA